MTTPKRPEGLSHAKLAWALRRLQLFMYLDEYENKGWNEDKEINGGDLVEFVGELLEGLNLVPREEQP